MGGREPLVGGDDIRTLNLSHGLSSEIVEKLRVIITARKLQSS